MQRQALNKMLDQSLEDHGPRLSGNRFGPGRGKFIQGFNVTCRLLLDQTGDVGQESGRKDTGIGSCHTPSILATKVMGNKVWMACHNYMQL